ncbi:DNA adenine methylase, partial [Desulfurella sp.]
MKSPIRWFGGKSHLVKKLLNYIPKHQYYLELFGGGASLL